MDRNEIIQFMKSSAIAVGSTVVEVSSFDEAYAYIISICLKKDHCCILHGGNIDVHSLDMKRTIAVPNCTGIDNVKFNALCAEHNIYCIQKDLRNHLGGFDIGISQVDVGIAETGTCVVFSHDENVRLASMLCECHMAILPKSKIVATSYDAEEVLEHYMKQDGPHYTACISGPSRTADIERVLSIGVHGPLELHLIIVEG